MNLAFSDLEAQRAFGGKLVVGLIWLMAGVVIVTRAALGGEVVGAAIASCGLGVGATLAHRLAGRQTLGRALTGVALMAQVSVLVAIMAGRAWQIDMHMAYFAALALLVIYCDWIVIALAAVTVAVHHLTLSFLLPMAVFPGGAGILTGLGRVVVHAVILIVEAATLIATTLSLNAMFVVADDARRHAESAVLAAEAAREAAQSAEHSREAARAEFAREEGRLQAERTQAVSTLAEQLARLARGELSARIEPEFEREYAAIKIDFNAAAASLQAAVAAVDTATGTIGAGADGVAVALSDLSARTQTQAESVAKTAAVLDEITAAVRRTAESADQVFSMVSAAKGETEHSGAVVRQAVDAMTAIEGSSRQIGQIIGVIDEIAFQTNLLALNAGVEAARAGDAGRGFAVVASEVRALAQRSADAAKEIKNLISASMRQVVDGVALVGDTGRALEKIVVQVNDINAVVANITTAVQAQADGIGQVNRAVDQIDQDTQKRAGLLLSATQGSQSLVAEAKNLRSLMSGFELAAAGPAGATIRPPLAPQAPARRPERPKIAVGARGASAAQPEDGWDEF